MVKYFNSVLKVPAGFSESPRAGCRPRMSSFISGKTYKVKKGGLCPVCGAALPLIGRFCPGCGVNIYT